jgi:hypothetical protein
MVAGFFLGLAIGMMCTAWCMWQWGRDVIGLVDRCRNLERNNELLCKDLAAMEVWNEEIDKMCRSLRNQINARDRVQAQGRATCYQESLN